jgi:Zn-finger nucleic acid-binding protein
VDKSIPYKVAKSLLGKSVLKFGCPQCGEALESEVLKAGEQDTCPACATVFTVPGLIVRQKYETALAERDAQREQLRREREAKEAVEEAERIDRNKRAEEARKAELEKLRQEDAAAREAWEKRNASVDLKKQIVAGPESLESIAIKLEYTHKMLERRQNRHLWVGLGMFLIGLLWFATTGVQVRTETIMSQTYEAVLSIVPSMLVVFGIVKMIAR